MESAPFSVTPLDAAVGAEISGVDARHPPGREVMDALKRVIGEHGLIVLRDQVLTEEEHGRFAEAFGDTVVPWLNAVEQNTVAKMDELPGRPGYTGAYRGSVYFFNGPRYRDEPEDGYLQGWHADMTHLQVPLPYALLNAIEAPEQGYETWYSNQYSAYEDLSYETKKRVDDLLITHSFQHVFPRLPPVVHPVILTHPHSGRRCIYGIPGVADVHPLGLTKAEAAEVMESLTEHLETGRFVYRHEWRTGDLVVWDNRCVLHRRGPQMKGQTRILRRIMAGDGDAETVRKMLMGY